MRLTREKHDVEQKMIEPHQQSAWMVWLLSIVTFFLTVAIVLGLFWAGRWVVHRFTRKPTTSPIPTTSNTRDQAKSASGSKSTGGSSSTGTTAPSAGSSSQASPSAATPPTTGNTTAPTSTPTSNNLVNTGPTSDE